MKARVTIFCQVLEFVTAHHHLGEDLQVAIPDSGIGAKQPTLKKKSRMQDSKTEGTR